MQNDIKKTILKKIKAYDEIVIARHVSPDPDAICSQLALRDAILGKYPNKKVYAVGATVSKFKKYGILDKPDYSKLNKALLITLDVPNFYRVDGINNFKPKEIIKIDHHPFEEKFGPIEWIDEEASSTCQMLTELLLKSNLDLSYKVASNLFIGTVSDSDRFLLPYTTTKTFSLVIELIKRTKLNFTSLYGLLYERDFNEVKFQAYLTNNLTINKSGFAYIIITDDIINEYKVDLATASNTVNSFNNIKDIYVWAFATEDKKNNQYRINIRSKGPIINEVASKYHGGGHKYASGAKVDSLDKVNELFKELDKVSSEYKENVNK